jgi:type II secretory pathway pseudopilin PulG
MKTFPRTKHSGGLTMIEVLMVLAVLMLLAAFLLPGLGRRYGSGLQCINNIKQIGLAYRVWEGDNGDRYPMAVSETNGGTMEFTTGPNAFRHFQVMSNELSNPKVLFCPNESDHARTYATNWSISNSNLSYFVGVDATETNAQMILSGDHNITNGTPAKNGLLELTPSRLAGWTAEVHNRTGNIGLADGSAQQVSTSGLQTLVASTGVATNRLQMP